MTIQHLIEQLHALKLTGMAAALLHQREQPDIHALPFEQRLGMVVEREMIERDNRRLSRLLKTAKLRVPACVEDVDYRHPRGIERKQNLCLTGPTGTGKTWLACALGNQACHQGYSVRYVQVPRLFEQLRIAHGDGSYPRLMSQFAKTDLLILDDWGIQKINAAQRNDLMEVIEDRHELKSTLIASQLPIEHWHDYIGEATLADAILDRLLHNAHRLSLKALTLTRRDPVMLT